MRTTTWRFAALLDTRKRIAVRVRCLCHLSCDPLESRIPWQRSDCQPHVESAGLFEDLSSILCNHCKSLCNRVTTHWVVSGVGLSFGRSRSDNKVSFCMEDIHLGLEGSSDDDTPEREDRQFYVASKMIWEASQHLLSPGFTPLEFAIGYYSLWSKRPPQRLPAVSFRARPVFYFESCTNNHCIRVPFGCARGRSRPLSKWRWPCLLRRANGLPLSFS